MKLKIQIVYLVTNSHEITEILFKVVLSTITTGVSLISIST
jgi:hypothetical protein